MTDSEYLTSSRYKKTDKLLYDELNVSLNVNDLRNKYFKTTNFNNDIKSNIQSNYKVYNIDNKTINRVIIKGYKKDNIHINNYLYEFNMLYKNTLLIWCEYNTKKTYVYFNLDKVREYNCILTSTILILKELIKDKNI